MYEKTENLHCNVFSRGMREYVALSQVVLKIQLADMFTKALPEDRFKYLVRRIGMRCLTPAELEVVRLGINPMIQPEPEDLPKDNPKLEIAVLRSVINELTSEEIVSLNFIESIKEARSRVQDLTSGEIVSSKFD
ncbi:hypothetical protein Tco_1328346 [Tanacetum coccineum]